MPNGEKLLLSKFPYNIEKHRGRFISTSFRITEASN